eukprot:scaffold1035_cov192-Ochromonas_danica.AAC.12
MSDSREPTSRLLNYSGIQHLKLLQLTSSRRAGNEGELNDLEFIDAVLADIHLRRKGKEEGKKSTAKKKRKEHKKKIDGDESSHTKRAPTTGVADEEVAAISAITLHSRPVVKAHHIASLPFHGDLRTNLSSIEMQVRSIVQSGQEMECGICKSAEVQQQLHLRSLAAWRTSLMQQIGTRKNFTQAKSSEADSTT